MNILEFTVLVWLGSIFAGFFGSFTGLGGGVIIVPLLTLAFSVDVHYAAGAALISVIATSAGAASSYLREGFTNVRVGMFLSIATTVGALFGASLATVLPGKWVEVIFGAVLIVSAYLSRKAHKNGDVDEAPGSWIQKMRLDGNFPTPEGVRHYHVRRVPLGFLIMSIAGTLSGLLGIGAGAFKVLAMDQAMRMPFKASTTTSNFMIGVTAAAGVGVYLNHGYLDPGLAMPVMLGVVIGSAVGARVLIGAESKTLRIVFSVIIVLLGIEMIYNGLAGKL
jgi:uncharacterized membrane protein YfcA